MKKLLGILVLGLLWCNEVFAVATDFNLKISWRRTGADANVYITDTKSMAHIVWYVDGECSYYQKTTQGIAEIYLTNNVSSADIIAYISDNRTSADKWTCIIDVDSLSSEEKELFKLD